MELLGRQFYCLNHQQWSQHGAALLDLFSGHNLLEIGFDDRGLSWSQYAQVLGRECQILLIDARQHFSGNAFLAVAATLVEPGLLILIQPDLPWATMVKWRTDAVQLEVSAYIARLDQILNASPHVVSGEQAITQLLSITSTSLNCSRTLRVAEQSEMLLEMQQWWKSGTQHAALLARRGRGKTTLLARFLAETIQPYLICAPRKTAVNVMKPWVDTSSTYIAIDALLQRQDWPPLLIVDEASSFPARLINQLLARPNTRVVLASTLDGYEGSALGLRDKVLKPANAQGSLSLFELKNAIRWSAEDKLEPLLDNMWPNAPYQLDAAVVAANNLQGLCWHYHHAPFVLNEPTIRDICQLWHSAHYQNRPDDLWQLLDDPQVSLAWFSIKGHVVAAAMVVDEGQIDYHLAQDIIAGKRRPPGNLIPQLMLHHSQDIGWAEQRIRRVVRIAVRPDLQGQGLGRQLIENLLDQARLDRVDGLGASFGAEPQLLQFWQQLGFRCLHQGYRVNPASGLKSELWFRKISN